MLTGDADGIWPSPFMADRIVARMDAASSASSSNIDREVRHVRAPKAGHPVYPLFRLTDRVLMAGLIRLFGGSYRINRRAQKRNWPIVLDFFRRHLAPKP